MVEVHFHAVYDRIQPLSRKIKCGRHVCQCFRNGMARLISASSIEYGLDLLPPPCELGARNRGIGAFIDHIVHLPAEGIEGSDRPALFQRQIEKAVIKAGTALYRFFLTILVWGHDKNLKGIRLPYRG